MACDVQSDKLDAYVDGELPSADAAKLASHVRGCGDCSAAILERVQLKRAVAVAGQRYVPSAKFRGRIMNTVGVKTGRSTGWKWLVLGFPAVSVLVLSLLVGFYVSRETSRRERVYSELVDLHVGTLASASPLDVVSSDRHTVKPWFQGKIPFTFNLPELQGSEFSLLGGRISYLGQEPGAELIYQLRKHEISVFIFQDRGSVMSVPSNAMRALSFSVENWSQNGLRYFLVGDVSAEDIQALSKLLKTAG